LAFNKLSADTLNILLPQVSFLNLSGNSYSRAFGRLELSAPSVADFSQNDFQCPLPDIPKSTVVVDTECTTRLDSPIWILLFVVLGAGLVAYLWTSAKRSAPSYSSNRRLKLFLLFGCRWMWKMADFVTDLFLISSMLAYVNSQETDCSLLNEVWLPVRNYFSAGVEYAPVQEYETFAEWIQEIILLSPTFEDAEVASFRDTVCSTEVFANCVYEPDTWTCEANPDFRDPLATFRVLVWLFASINLAKELVKLLVLVWYARTSIPLSWRYVCNINFLASGGLSGYQRYAARAVSASKNTHGFAARAVFRRSL
jgi:hypothetical protein